VRVRVRAGVRVGTCAVEQVEEEVEGLRAEEGEAREARAWRTRRAPFVSGAHGRSVVRTVAQWCAQSLSGAH
jgi:hypothetical protein